MPQQSHRIAFIPICLYKVVWDTSRFAWTGVAGKHLDGSTHYYSQLFLHTWYQCCHTTATRQAACLSPHMMRMISIEICSLPCMCNELVSLHQEKESRNERHAKGTRRLGNNCLLVHPAAFRCLCLPCSVTAPPHSLFIHTTISSARCWFLALMSTLVCYAVAKGFCQSPQNHK